MSVNSFNNNNINSFNLYTSRPSFRQTGQMQNIFIPEIIEQNRVQTPFISEQIKTLNLKNNLLAKFLPQNFIAKYLNDGFVKKQLQNNPNIEALLKEKGLNVDTNLHNVHNIIHSHLIPTQNYAKLIMEKSGINFSLEDYSTMEEAALLHDIGKIFIPSEILNKKGDLTQQEREIMQLHDQLGAELLKNTQLNRNVLNLIESHHNSSTQNNILTQILKIADIYSALKESRSYKNSLSEKETFDVLYQKAQNGEFDTKLVDTLKKALQETKHDLQNTVIA